jgi:hypothetical protein
VVENKPPKSKGPLGAGKAKADRLAAALRDNLRRRKAQARAKDAEPEAEATVPPEKTSENR